MDMLDLDRFKSTPVATDPFLHMVVPNFVRPEWLTAVVNAIPPIGARGSVPVEALRLGSAAADLMTAMAGSAVREAIAEKFALDLRDAPVMVTVRGQTGARDGQIHCDSAAKRVTILLYLNAADAAWDRQEGCLRLLRGPDNLEDFAVEVPPVNGTLLVFPNGPDTWHGHKTFIGKRITVQMNYMTDDAHAKYEMRRHRVSALFKRLSRVA
jgi:hypothetical protein